MSKINIYWIEDNPKGVTVSWNENLFNVLLFQNIIELKEYLELFQTLRQNNKTSNVLTIAEKSVPDIVIYDYLLSDSLLATDDSLMYDYSDDDDYTIVKKYSASQHIKDIYPALFKSSKLFIEDKDLLDDNFNYSNLIEKFDISQDNKGDEFGLYCGLALLREFVDYPIVAIPSTRNKEDFNRLQQGGKFFEWLNDYDLQESIDFIRKKTKKKDVKDINGVVLPFAVKLLRKRILTQIKSSKITVDLENLIKLFNVLKENGVEKLLSENFIFNSPYGTKKMPIKGLFIDCEDYSDNEKLKVIKNDFLDKILSLLKTEQLEVKRAKEISDILWETYTNPNEFENRMELSDFHFRIEKEVELTEEEEKRYKNHLNQFGADRTKEIQKEKYITIEKFKSESHSILRLAIAHLIAKLFISYQRRFEIFYRRNAYFPPDIFEIYSLLNPIKNSEKDLNLILPIHYYGFDKNPDIPLSKFLETFGRKIETKQKDKSAYHKNEIITKTNWEKMSWLSEGEKKIIHSFFPNEKDYYPNWLKI